MYAIRMLYPNGEEQELEDRFDTYDEAEDTAVYYCGCYKQGGEILNMSNPGDYPLAEEECDYEIFEADE